MADRRLDARARARTRPRPGRTRRARARRGVARPRGRLVEQRRRVPGLPVAVHEQREADERDDRVAELPARARRSPRCAPRASRARRCAPSGRPGTRRDRRRAAASGARVARRGETLRGQSSRRGARESARAVPRCRRRRPSSPSTRDRASGSASSSARRIDGDALVRPSQRVVPRVVESRRNVAARRRSASCSSHSYGTCTATSRRAARTRAPTPINAAARCVSHDMRGWIGSTPHTSVP